MPKHCVSIVFAASPSWPPLKRFSAHKATNMLEIRQMGDHMSPCADKRARCDFRHPCSRRLPLPTCANDRV